MFAKLDITLRGNRVIFNATKSVTISGGGSYTRWSKAGIISGTLGKWTVYAAKREQFGAKSLGVNVQGLPHVDMHYEQFKLLTPTGKPLQKTAYVMSAPLGAHTSATDAEGQTTTVHTADATDLQVQLQWLDFDIPAPQKISDASDANSSSNPNSY
jgi:type VI secretion system secreted protein VgrG